MESLFVGIIVSDVRCPQIQITIACGGVVISFYLSLSIQCGLVKEIS